MHACIGWHGNGKHLKDKLKCWNSAASRIQKKKDHSIMRYCSVGTVSSNVYLNKLCCRTHFLFEVFQQGSVFAVANILVIPDCSSDILAAFASKYSLVNKMKRKKKIVHHINKIQQLANAMYVVTRFVDLQLSHRHWACEKRDEMVQISVSNIKSECLHRIAKRPARQPTEQCLHNSIT